MMDQGGLHRSNSPTSTSTTSSMKGDGDKGEGGCDGVPSASRGFHDPSPSRLIQRVALSTPRATVSNKCDQYAIPFLGCQAATTAALIQKVLLCLRIYSNTLSPYSPAHTIITPSSHSFIGGFHHVDHGF